jgi:putative Mg2+ transporter-C (MgtC) family protein
VFLGLLVGAERTRVGKRAGMRTYALVALGSALFTVISGMVSASYQNIFDFDPLRVASQIVVGVGFLGAGVIYVQRSSITGLTTAAGLWVVAGVGMASGFGFKFIAFFVTFIMLVVFELLWYIEDKFIKNNRQSEEGEQPS